MRYSLGGSDWKLAESVSEDWRFRQLHLGQEENIGAFARTRWIPATVPGCVQWDLLRAGLIPDPYFGENSKLCEWVSQRQWVYQKRVKVPGELKGKPVHLCFDGVDYAAKIFWDGVSVGEVEGLYGKRRFRLEAAAEHLLTVVLKEAPTEQGQLGRTSQTQTLKPRLGYWWDFGTRLVNVGLWRDVWLEPVLETEIIGVRFNTKVFENRAVVSYALEVERHDALMDQDAGRRGDPLWSPSRAVAGDVRGGRKAAPLQEPIDDHGVALPFRVQLFDPENVLVVESPSPNGTLEIPDPKLWWPNGLRDQPLYTLRAECGGSVWESRIGLREITLIHNTGRTDALPYTFTVNRRATFARGFNWVTPDLMYGRGDLEGRYRHLLQLAKDAGANLIRVNGVNPPEREVFYALCDELGLMVWQEFTLTSSGTDNLPPTSEEFLKRLEVELPHLIRERRHHACLAVWGGGNELSDLEKRPVGLDHSTVARMLELVREHDPERLFLPTSPSGPEYDLLEEVSRERPHDQHDVHGSWHYRGLSDTYRPFHDSAALFHSEFGCQGAAYPGTLRRFARADFPPDDQNPDFMHHGSWWMMRHRVEEVFGLVGEYATYWRLSQALQAETVRYAVHANRRRYPKCSGALIWQLSEPWPNAHNTALVDYYGNLKLAYFAAKNAFAPAFVGLWYSSPRMPDRLEFTPEVLNDAPLEGKLELSLYTLEGELIEKHEYEVNDYLPSFERDGLDDACMARVTLRDRVNSVVSSNDYLFTRNDFHAVRKVAATRLVAWLEGRTLTLRNTGDTTAYWLAVEALTTGHHLFPSDGGFHLLPGGERSITLRVERRCSPDTDTLGRALEAPRISVGALNTPALILEVG